MIIVESSLLTPTPPPDPTPDRPPGFRGYPVGTVVGRWPLTIAGIKMDAVDERFVEWAVESFDGHGSAAPSGETATRTSDHGAVAIGPWYRQSMAMTAAGSADCGTPTLRFDAEERLRRAVAAVEFDLVRHDEVERQQRVRLNGGLEITRGSNPAIFDFEIPMIALDPRLYSTTVRTLKAAPSTVSSRLAVPHAVPHPVPPRPTIIRTAEAGGTDTAWPTWTFIGPMVNPSLTNVATGEALRFDLTLLPNQTLVVNTHPSNRTVLLNGDPDLTRRSTAYGRWWGLRPGQTPVLFATDAPIAAPDQLLGEWRDTWL